MRNLVKTTLLGLGLATVMVSCTKDNQEMIELSETKEVAPIKKVSPNDTIFEELLPPPTKQMPSDKITPAPTELLPADELQNGTLLNPNEQTQRKYKKTPDMGIIKENHNEFKILR